MVAGAVPPAAVNFPGAGTPPTVARGDLGSALVAANAVPDVTVFGNVPPAAGAVLELSPLLLLLEKTLVVLLLMPMLLLLSLLLVLLKGLLLLLLLL